MRNARPTDYGWQFYTRINGELVTEHFRPHELKNGREPTQREVDDWVGLKRAVAAGTALPAEEAGPTLAERVARYLPQVRSMRTYAEREKHMQWWMSVLGADTPADRITSSDLRTQLEILRVEKRAAASTLNHLRTAMMHMGTVLDGKRAPNPAADVPRYREPELPPRDLSPAAIDAIFAELPDDDLTARLTLWRWTGWPPQLIRTLTPQQIVWGEAVNMSRSKGKGVRPRWIPLLPHAWTALEAFRDRKLFGRPFPSWALRTAFREAAKRARARTALPEAIRQELRNVTPYQLRHTFGTIVAAVTKDERATMDLLIQSDIRQTHRYTKGSVQSRSSAAITAVADVLATLATKGVESRRVARKRKRAKGGRIVRKSTRK